MMNAMKRPTTGPVIRGPVTAHPVWFQGRLCGRCLQVVWHPDSVRAGWCPSCEDTTPGAVVKIRDAWVDREAQDLLRAVHALATP